MTIRLVLCLFLSLLAVPAAAAADKPTAEQAREITLKAADIIARDGIDKARPQFHAEGPFRFGEIYVNVIDLNGTWLIYPPNPRNEGKSVLNVRDADGKLLVQDIIRTASERGEGWVEYRWLNPASNAIEQKTTFVKLIAERQVIAYVGVYK